MMGIFVLGLLSVILSTGFCQVPEGSIRLSGHNHNLYEGRVELFYNGSWGTICSRFFSKLEAQVVCRQLGIRNEVYVAKSKAVMDGRYGQGVDNAIIDDIRCLGNELSVLQCQLAFCINVPCIHSLDVGVICHPPPAVTYRQPTTIPWFAPVRGTVAPVQTVQPKTSPNTIYGKYLYNYGICNPLYSANAGRLVRLVEDTSKCCDSGVVQMFIHGQWIGVCDDFWEIVDAKVICRYLCYEPSQSMPRSENVNIDYILEPMMVTNMSCSGSEASPFQCRYSYRQNSCGRNKMAMVTCGQLIDTNIVGKRKRRSANRMYITSKAILMYDQVEDEDAVHNIDIDPMRINYTSNVSTISPATTKPSKIADSVLFASGESSKGGNKDRGGNKHRRTTAMPIPTNTRDVHEKNTTKAVIEGKVNQGKQETNDVHKKITTKAVIEGEVNQEKEEHISYASYTNAEVKQNADQDKAAEPNVQANLVHNSVDKVAEERLGPATASVKELTEKELDAILKSTQSWGESVDISRKPEQPVFQKLVGSSASRLHHPKAVVVFILAAFILF